MIYDFSEIFGPLPELNKLIRSVKFLEDPKI